MKHFVRFLLVTVLLLVLFTVASCGKTPDVPPTEIRHTLTVYSYDGTSTSTEVPEGSMPSLPTFDSVIYTDTEKLVFTGWNREIAPVESDVVYVPVFNHSPRATYEITWYFEGDNYTVTTVKEGDIPTPPESIRASYETAIARYTLTGWEPALAPASADAEYEAIYDEFLFTFTVTFSVNGQETSQRLLANEIPVFNGNTDKPADDRYTYIFAGWDTPIDKVRGDITYTAVYTMVEEGKHAFAFPEDLLRMAYTQGDAQYIVGNGQKTAPWNGMTALFYLLLEERSTPGIIPVREAIFRQLRALIRPGNEPDMGGGPQWSHATCAAAIALAKETPTIWSQLTESEIERLDLLMRCLLYTSAFEMNDCNDYKTTIAMQGNFRKTWNPNFRWVGIVPLIAARQYFGSATRVDELLLAFDYDQTIADLTQYGFTNARTNFQRAGKTLLENGGDALVNGSYAGTGSGVRHAFLYKGYSLDQYVEILNDELAYMFSGGRVVSRLPETNPVAYILDGKTSPVEGKLGMYLELNGGDVGGIRSSASYSMADLHMGMTALAFLVACDAYDPVTDMPQKLINLMNVGNTDLLFKLHAGYMNYSNGASSGAFYFGSYGMQPLIEDIWLNHLAVLFPMVEMDDYAIRYVVGGVTTEVTSPTKTVTLNADLLPEGYIWFDGEKTFYRPGSTYTFASFDELTLTAVHGSMDADTATLLANCNGTLILKEGATVDAQYGYQPKQLYSGWILLDIRLEKDGDFDLPNAFNIQYKHTTAPNPATGLVNGTTQSLSVTVGSDTTTIATFEDNVATLTVAYNTTTGQIFYYKKTATGYEKVFERIATNDEGTAGRLLYIYISKSQAQTEKHLKYSVAVYYNLSAPVFAD